MDHRHLEKVSYKAQSMLCAALAENFHPSGRRATVIFRGMADPPTSWANQSIRASIVGLSTKSEDIARPTVARTYLLGEFESTRRRSKAQGVGPGCCRKSDMMKALITALALLTLISGPTFARPAARASTQAEFVFPTDQQLCRSGQTDFCHWRGYPLWQWYSGA
jgi:hypothetical protein